MGILTNIPAFCSFLIRYICLSRIVEEIPGLSKQYDMEFFRNLENKCGIRLENIVYYKVNHIGKKLLIGQQENHIHSLISHVKDLTHYFVMTAKKDSLVRKGVIRKDTGDLLETQKTHVFGLQMIGRAYFIRTT